MAHNLTTLANTPFKQMTKDSPLLHMGHPSSEVSPRCSYCGHPLVAWDERHTPEDCQEWLSASEKVRERTEALVKLMRSEGGGYERA